MKGTGVKVAAVVAALALLIAGAVWVSGRTGGTSDDVAAPEGPAADDAAGPGAAEDVPVEVQELVRELPPDGAISFWLDGWSARTLAGSGVSSLWVTFAGDDLTPIFEQELQFSPASEGRLSGLAEADPDALARLMARMVRYDPLLRCEVSGCTSQRGEVPLGWLADVSSTPVFSQVYGPWSVEHGALVASVQVPEEAVFARVEGEGVSPLTAPLLRLIDVPVEEEEIPGTAPRFNDGREVPVESRLQMVSNITVGGAFGRLFELDPQWLTADTEAAGVLLSPSELPSASGELPSPLRRNERLMRGLSHPVPDMVTASNGLLTLLSSPTVGCYGALCVPTAPDSSGMFAPAGLFGVHAGHEHGVEGSMFPDDTFRLSGRAVEVESLTVSPVTVCPAEGEDVADRSVKYLAVPSVQVWAFDIARPFHQWSLWGGRSAEELDGHLDGGVGVFTGDPVLVNGPVEVRMFTTWLYAGSDLRPMLVEVVPLGDREDVTAQDWPEFLSGFEPCS